MSHSPAEECFMCGLLGCDCESDNQSMDKLVNLRLTRCLQTTRAEVAALRKENRELHNQHSKQEDAITVLKAALAEKSKRLQALRDRIWIAIWGI